MRRRPLDWSEEPSRGDRAASGSAGVEEDAGINTVLFGSDQIPRVWWEWDSLDRHPVSVQFLPIFLLGQSYEHFFFKRKIFSIKKKNKQAAHVYYHYGKHTFINLLLLK